MIKTTPFEMVFIIRDTMTELIQRILPTVQKPARYTGGEFNEVKKDLKDVRVRVAFCFPDTYEIGMSNVGMRILYGVMNQMDGVWCERVFAPWGDMEAAMRQHDLPLWALESQNPVKEFDMVAFTIGYEMSYSNILNMLALSKIPLRSSQREGLKNIVFAGGVCAYNPEPLADFVDFFALGEGEEITPEIISLYDRAKAEDWSKEPSCMRWQRSPVSMCRPSTAMNTMRMALFGRLFRWMVRRRELPSASWRIWTVPTGQLR